MKRDIDNQRECTNCKQMLDISLFYNKGSRCKKCDSKRRKELYTPEKGHKAYKKITEEQKESRRQYARNKRNANIEKAREKLRSWRKNNPDYKKNRWKSDIKYRLKENIRGRIYKAVKGFTKGKSSEVLLGCTIQFLKDFLEENFTENMSWDNYGEWHIDHIKPCALFDLTLEKEQRDCFHYTNLQPLWAKDNLQKNIKYEEYKISTDI